MAILIGHSNVDATFCVRLDVQNVLQRVQAAENLAATTPPVVTAVYVGEAHSNAFDVARRKAVIAALADARNTLVVVERTLALGTECPRMVVERNEFSSADDGRNKQVVDFMTEDRSESGMTKTIVILFGQDHITKLRKHFLQSLGKDVKVRWHTLPPVDESFETTLPRHVSTFSTVGKRPVGYCDPSGAPYQMLFLEKGYVPDPFGLELYLSRDTFEDPVYAIYYRDQQDETKQRDKLDRDGYAEIQMKFKRLDGSRVAIAKKIKRGQIAAAEAATLDV